MLCRSKSKIGFILFYYSAPLVLIISGMPTESEKEFSRFSRFQARISKNYQSTQKLSTISNQYSSD